MSIGEGEAAPSAARKTMYLLCRRGLSQHAVQPNWCTSSIPVGADKTIEAKIEAWYVMPHEGTLKS